MEPGTFHQPTLKQDPTLLPTPAARPPRAELPLPDFTPDNIEDWFTYAEICFSYNDEDELSRFAGTVQKLDPATKELVHCSMVERMHLTLKTAIRAQPDPESWFDCLPLVLLGMRTAVKEPINSSASKMVFGTTLRLPGQLLDTSLMPSDEIAEDYVRRLNRAMLTLQPTPPRARREHVFIDPALKSCTHVFVRIDTVRRPLQPPYEGPYEVLARAEKTITLDRKGKRETISIDRVKPAHLETQQSNDTLNENVSAGLPPPTSRTPSPSEQNTAERRRPADETEDSDDDGPLLSTILPAKNVYT